MDNTKTEKWITQLHKHVWWLLDTLTVTYVHKLNSSMKVSPSPVWELALFCIKEPFSQSGMWALFSCAKATQGGALSELHGNVTCICIKGWGSDVMCGGAKAQYNNQWDLETSITVWMPKCDACDVFLTLNLPLCAEVLSDGKTGLMWESDYQLPVQTDNQSVRHPYVKGRVLQRVWVLGYQHIGLKSLGSHCMSITVQSASLSSGKTTNKQFQCYLYCRAMPHSWRRVSGHIPKCVLRLCAWATHWGNLGTLSA